MTKQHLASAEAETNTPARRDTRLAAFARGQAVMSALSPCRLTSALAVLAALPAPALADLVERIIDRLDVLDGNADAEPDQDGEADQDNEASAGDDGPWWTPAVGLADCGPMLARLA